MVASSKKKIKIEDRLLKLGEKSKQEKKFLRKVKNSID